MPDLEFKVEVHTNLISLWWDKRKSLAERLKIRAHIKEIRMLELEMILL